jgi:cyclase
MKLGCALKLSAPILMGVLLTVPLHAQEKETPISIHPLVDGKVYWAEGDGGNSGIIIGNSGVIVIDVKTTTGAGSQLVQAVAKLTPKPITHVIETHSDGDHIGGIAAFPEGIKIIGHINNKNEQRAVLAYATPVPGGGKCAPVVGRLPDMVVYKSEVSATLDGERFVFHHFGPAHTSGDLIIELPDYKIAFVGDIITSTAPIHPEKNGSLAGWFINANHLLEMNVDSYVGGHATAPFTKTDMRQRIADWKAITDKVDSLVLQGKTADDLKAIYGKDADQTLGCSGVPRPSMVMEEYNEKADKAEELK